MLVYSGFWFALVSRLSSASLISSCSDLSSFLPRFTKLGLFAEATLFFLQIWLFVSCCCLVYFITFFRIGLLFGSLRESHQGVAAGTSFGLCCGVRAFTCGSLLSLGFVSFVALRCFVWIRLFEGLFCLTRAKPRLRLSFCSKFSFPFSFLLRFPI